MEKVFKFLSAVIFAVVVLGFIVLGIYIFFIKESPTHGVAVIGEKTSEVDPTKPVGVIDDILSEQPKPEKSLEEYAYKVEEQPLSPLDILLYILGAIVGLYLLKKIVQLWNYIVKNSV